MYPVHSCMACNCGTRVRNFTTSVKTVLIPLHADSKTHSAIPGDKMLAAGAQRGVLSGGRCFTTAAAAQASALPAISEGASTAGGWLSKIFGGSSRISTPLTDPLPGVELPSPAAVLSGPPSTETTSLSNGVTIASEATPVGNASLA